MLKTTNGLSDSQVQDLLDLERRVVDADGGRLKLEVATLGRGQQVLWQEDGRLLGFLGVYAFGAPAVELAGAVDPAARRRGIGGALLAEAVRLTQGRAPVLLLVPRTSAGGRALAERAGARLGHSEHALVLSGPPTGRPGPAVAVRPAGEPDAAVVSQLLSAGFDEPARLPSADDLAHTLVVEVPEGGGHVPVGTLRLTRDGGSAAVHGFVIDPSRQGRGLGREVLRQVSAQALQDGATSVRLEVATDNERALGLYTSLGFAPVITEDYWRLP